MRTTGTARFIVFDGKWKEYPPGTAFRCVLNVFPEREGGFSAVCANLPGVADGGDTQEEAVKNALQAFRLTVQVYQDEGIPIAWRKKTLKPPRRGKQLHFTVDMREVE